jgi:hypothetical protein
MREKCKKHENFKNIPEYEGLYLCSDGNIKALPKMHEWNGKINILPEHAHDNGRFKKTQIRRVTFGKQ